MCRVASAPNPVETPYVGVGGGGQLLHHGAGAAHGGLGGRLEADRAPPRATASTSTESGPVPTGTGGGVGCVVMGPIQRPRPGVDQCGGLPAVSHARREDGVPHRSAGRTAPSGPRRVSLTGPMTSVRAPARRPAEAGAARRWTMLAASTLAQAAAAVMMHGPAFLIPTLHDRGG